MNINREFISRNNINGIGNPCRYIIIHETDNFSPGANARAHARAQYQDDFEDMSVHYYCGSDGIYQAAEHTCKCWHIGRRYVSNPRVPEANNNNSIGIEICVNRDGNYAVARENAIELTRHLLQTTDIPASRVLRHYDPTGKHCPRNMMDDPRLWMDFKTRIQTGGAPPNTDPEWKAIGTATCTGNAVNVRSEPRMGDNVLLQLWKGQRFEIDGQKEGPWIRVNVQGTIGWMHENYVKRD